MTSAENVARAAACVARSQALVAESRAIRSTALWMKVRSQDARGARRFCGGNDDGVGRIVTAVLGRSLCSGCIAHKAGVLVARVDDVLVRTGHTIRAQMTFGTCEECRTQTVVHRIG